MSKKKTVFKLNKEKAITLLVLFMGIGAVSNQISGIAIGQTISQNENQSNAYIANVNEVKTFIYSWFALLDRQVSEISLLKFVDKDNLLMQFPEMTVNNPDDFSKWYLGIKKAIKSNTYDVQQLEVTPKDNGKFDVQLTVNWQAQTREGEAITKTYQQQWEIVTDTKKRLLIQRYVVEEVK